VDSTSYAVHSGLGAVKYIQPYAKQVEHFEDGDDNGNEMLKPTVVVVTPRATRSAPP